LTSGAVRVAAAVIARANGDVLLAQRPPGRPYAGYWEFPGGKLEPGETPAHALSRELHEELGIDVHAASPWLVQEFVYPHAHVELNFFRVRAWLGEPVGRDGQAFARQHPSAIAVAPLLPANTRVLAALRLPEISAITCAGDVGEATFLARAARAFEAGVRLVEVREKGWDTKRRDGFAAELNGLAQRFDARVLLNGDVESARSIGCAGVHWTSRTLAAAASRPRDLLVGASCHTHADVMHASALDVDFVVLGPVLATPTHPDAVPLGWSGFAAAVAGTRVPVFALGGLHRDDLDVAIAHGAHGVAMRRHAWPR
jgi:8-oxo-dGTP diphosphatase